MGIATRYARRSAVALLAGAALALTLTVSTAGAAPITESTSGSAPVVSGRTDVFIRDVVPDVGYEPHEFEPLWQSPDIKVCHTPVECATSQNPIVGETNYIFVKLNNPGPYGTGTDTGTLMVYRTTPGGGAMWPTAWTLIGSTAVAAAPGTTTVMLTWDGVPGPGHFCLLARWVSPTDPMNGEGASISLNTRNNNNIAWRNVDSVVVRPNQPAEVRPFAIGNPLKVETRNDLVFTSTGEAFPGNGGKVVVDLGPTLFERWRAGGAVGKGIKVVGETQLQIVEPNYASINNLVLKPGERIAFSLYFSTSVWVEKPVTLAVTQYGPDAQGKEYADLGGVAYEITSDQKQES